jgi:hypothetical protein
MKNRMAPLTRDNLLRLINTCDPETLAGTRDRYLLALGWALAVPRSWLAVVQIEDAHPGWFVGYAGGLGEWHRDWLIALALAAGEPVLSGPLLWSITRYDQLSHPGMSGDAINDVVQRAVDRAGLAEPWRYSAHSLRLGGRAGV